MMTSHAGSYVQKRVGQTHVLSLTVLCLITALLAPAPGLADSILNSKHNLSQSGPGKIKSSHESGVCIFCHTPHHGTKDAPLWNRFSTGTTYTPYSSSTAVAKSGQPTGASRVCLSCHDGTVAMGMVRSRSAKIAFGGSDKISGRANLGTDLSDDHPISFVYDAGLTTRSDRSLADPKTLDHAVRMDTEKQLQCTTCHDPHDDKYGNFLVMDNTASALCTTCHKFDDWETSSHHLSTARWNGRSTSPWKDSKKTTVAANGCENCHQPHAAAGKKRLLTFAVDEDNCYSCHNGNVAKLNVQGEFEKMSVHPIASTRGIHDPMEDTVNARRHVTCVDCHNPHTSDAARTPGPSLPGSLKDVRGVNEAGNTIDAVMNEQELCYRCHADSVRRGSALIRRQRTQTNTRLEFDPGNASYHPVAAAGRNPDVPSLISPYKTSSRITCTDCHNNDQGPAEGGNGPRGPHGSSYRPILARRLDLADGSPESTSAYALCYKCHSRTSILRNDSFSGHYLHVVEQQTACTTCHDSHASADSPHLINFNVDQVKSYQGIIDHQDLGRFKGNCTLTCHSHEHNATTY